MFPVLQDNRGITPIAWMVILSIIPSKLVRVGAILLGSVICFLNVTHAIRPKTLLEKLQVRVLSLEEKLKIAVDDGWMAQTDATFTAQVERDMGRLRYRVADLHESTFLISRSILLEVKAVWRGHLFEIVACLRDVDTLAMDLEIHRATVMKNRYRSWR